MEKLSRTQKNAKLYEELENGRDTAIVSHDLKDYANKLNSIDNSFDKVEAKDSEQEAARVKSVTFQQFEDTNNDVLGGYLNEVKQYNKDKGVISGDDTQQNILKEIRTSASIRPFGHIEADDKPNEKTVVMDNSSFDNTTEIPFIKDEDINNTISFEIQKLLEEGQIESILEPVASKKPEEVIKPTTNVFDEVKLETMKEVPEKPYTPLMNETVQMVIEDNEEDYDDEKPNNRIINFILVIFILIMLVVLAVILYFILVNKGII